MSSSDALCGEYDSCISHIAILLEIVCKHTNADLLSFTPVANQRQPIISVPQLSVSENLQLRHPCHAAAEPCSEKNGMAREDVRGSAFPTLFKSIQSSQNVHQDINYYLHAETSPDMQGVVRNVHAWPVCRT